MTRLMWLLTADDKQKIKWKYNNLKFKVKHHYQNLWYALRYLWYTPGRLLSRAGSKGMLDWYQELRLRERAEKRIKHLETALKVQTPADVQWREECEKLRAQMKTLRADVNVKREALERKNRDLDSLHYVWCNGGCEGGVHRYDGKGPESVTEEIVLQAVHNVNRLITWYNSYEFKHLDDIDADGVHNRYIYIYGTRALKDAQEAAEKDGPAAAWKIVDDAIKEKKLRR